MTFCCNPGDRRRWEIALREGEDKESVSSVDSVWKLIGPHVTPSNAELERRAIYTVGTKLQGDDGRVISRVVNVPSEMEFSSVPFQKLSGTARISQFIVHFLLIKFM